MREGLRKIIALWKINICRKNAIQENVEKVYEFLFPLLNII